MKKVAGHEFKARVGVRDERSDGDWTGGEDRTTKGSLQVQFGIPKAAVRGGVSAALVLEVLEDISQKECAQVSR